MNWDIVGNIILVVLMLEVIAMSVLGAAALIGYKDDAIRKARRDAYHARYGRCIYGRRGVWTV